MKKVLTLVMTSLLTLGILSGCAAKTEPNTTTTEPATTTIAPKVEATKDIVIAGIYKAGDQQWFIGEGDAAKAKSIAMGAKDFMFMDAKMNPDIYLQALDNAIAQGVSGIIVCVPDQKLSAVTIEKCKAAGIPVIAVDDPIMDESGKFTAPYVGIDALEIGRACGDWTAKYAKENNMTGEDVGVLLLAADQISSCVPRTDGAKEKWMAAFPDWAASRIFRVDYNGPQEKAFDVASATFTANPKIKKWVVMAINDEGAAGATRALEQAGLDKEAVVCGIGGYIAKLEYAKAEGSAFKATAFINYVDIGEYSAENMMNFLLKGTEIPADRRTPAVMITKENYKEIMKDQAN